MHKSRAENTSVYSPHFLCLPYLYVTITCPRAACSYTLMLDAAAFSEMPTPIYQTPWRHIPADSNIVTAAIKISKQSNGEVVGI